MEHRTVIVREEGASVGTVSFIALLIVAAVIALMIWQPWNGTVMMRSTATTSIDTTSGTR
jgi:hypothetical protein